MLKLNAQAFPLNMIVNQLSDEYEVSKQAVYKDWRNRASWQTQLLELGDLSQLCRDLYATHKEIYRMAALEFLRGDNSNARVGALRLLRDLNLDFIQMFPRVIDTHIKGSKGDDINALLKEYHDLYEREAGEGQKTIEVRWDTLPIIDMRKFSEVEREQIREACRLLQSHTKRELVTLADGTHEVKMNDDAT
jgi:hypothetical protein